MSRAISRTRRLLAAGVGALVVTSGAAALAAPRTSSASPAASAAPATSSLLGDTGDTTFDARVLAAAVRPSAATVQAVRTLLAASGKGARATWDPRFGTLRSLRGTNAYLTRPATGSAVAVARAWLSSHAAAFSLTGAQVAALAVSRDHVLPQTGTHTITLTQTYAGIPAVQGGRLNVAVTKTGRILAYTGDPTPGENVAGTWTSGPTAALAAVAAKLAPRIAFTPTADGTLAGYTTYARGPFAGASYVQQAVFGTRSGPVAAFHVLFVKRLDQAWDTVVDATSGKLLYRASLVAHDELPDPKGTVYENYPGAAKGGSPHEASFGPTAESPDGYVDPTGLTGVGITTFGNNASSYANWSNFEVPADQGPRPVAPTGVFDFPYTNQWAATNGQTVPPSYAQDLDAAATNLFYQHNRIHDEYYRLGFTETAGNFQLNNFSNGGQQGDPILGLVQAGAASGGNPTYTGRDNAYMLTLPDGISPWSGMFLWEPIDDTFEGPYSDGDFDVSVIQHEYTHGLSTRYVGGGSALNSQQAGSMGEGWSDWYALNHLFNAHLATEPIEGSYVTGNMTRGIRNWNYNDDPTTFGDIGYDLTGPEVHADGEIWTATLWDLRKALVAQYGAARGATVAARIITDGMPLTAPDPSFLDARDGILSADLDRYHGDDTDLIWRVFAKRGAGASAVSSTGDDIDPIPAFDSPFAADNGTVTIQLRNATTGDPIPDAKLILGRFEARVTPLVTTGSSGASTIEAVAGMYPLTIQAAGFGVQTINGLTVTAGRNRAKIIDLAPNLASTAAGATVVSASSEDSGLPAKFAFDDTAASVWSTADNGTPYNAGPDENVTVKLAAPATVTSVRVSAYKATTASRFEALRNFTAQTSMDGVTWTTVRTGHFGYQAPRPVAPDLNFRTFQLATPTQAAYLRFFIDSVQGNTTTQAQVADVEVFGTDTTVGNGTVHRDPTFTDTGTIEGANPAAGDPTGLQNVFGVTGTELNETCSAPPASQGVDGWATTLPSGFGDGLHKVAVVGTSPLDDTVGHDLDLYFLDSACQLVGSAATASADESAPIPPGTAYVLTQDYTGADVAITVTASDTR